MTLRDLLLALSGFVAEAVRDYPFPSPDGNLRDCRVFLHNLPDVQEEGTYPFVIVRWQEGWIESMEDAKTVLRDTVALALGIHSPGDQEQAAMLCAELVDCLRRALWKKRLLAHCFELVEPLRSAMPDADRQQHRYHLATIETVWNYVWPPKALEEAGQSQLRTGDLEAASYSASELVLAWKKSKSGEFYER